MPEFKSFIWQTSKIKILMGSIENLNGPKLNENAQELMRVGIGGERRVLRPRQFLFSPTLITSRKHFSWFYLVLEIQVEAWEYEKCRENISNCLRSILEFTETFLTCFYNS